MVYVDIDKHHVCCAGTDDMLIKLWDWDKKWICTQVFEGHTHYVMQIVKIGRASCRERV